MKLNALGWTMAAPSPALTLKILVASLVGAGLVSSTSVGAQEVTANTASDVTVVTVTGLRKAAQTAQTIKKNSDAVLDSIVADDIGKFPDTNVAETLARVTGVQVSRDAGEANHVLIRGLPGIATVLNGRELFTTTGRYFQLADIPSTMLQRVDVYKSQSADLIEGGIAGVIDVRTNRPFDFKGLQLNVNGGFQNQDKAQKTDPNLSAMASNRWKTGLGEFGALVGLSYVKNSFHEERAFDVAPDAHPQPSQPNLMGPFVMGIQDIPGNRRRAAENVALQWRPNADTEFYLEGLSTHYLNNNETDFFVALPFLGGGLVATTFPGTNQLNTLESHGTFTIDSTQAHRDDNLTSQVALGGRWKLAPGWRLTSELARTTSSFEWANPILDTGISVPNVMVNTSINGTPRFSYTGIDMTDAKNFFLVGLFDRYGHDAGASTDWRADSVFTPNSDGLLKEVSAGVRISSRSARSIKSFEGNASAPATNVATIPGLKCVTTPLAGDYGLAKWFTPCANYLISDTGVIRQAVTGSSNPKGIDPGSYFEDVEKNYAVYAKAKIGFDIDKLPVDGVLGVRVVHANEELIGKSLSSGVYSPTPKSANGTDILPSASFKFTLRPDLIGRLAAAKTLTRPDFSQLNPGTAYVAPSVTVKATASGGNASLKPFTGRNLDGALEWYFAPTGSVSGTIFRHDFDGYILTDAKDELVNNVVYSVTRPFNTDKGYLQGLEVAYQQFYDDLPGWLNGLGMQANATFTQGKITSSTVKGSLLLNQTFPGMSKFSYNLVGLYERQSWSGRLAYNWRSKFTDSYNSTVPGGALTVAPLSSLDGSLSYKINPNLSLSLTGTNLLDFKYTDYWKNPNLYPRDTRRYDRTVGLAVHWKN